jgi:hypothetical protein
LQPGNNTFPARFLDLAADAIEISGATRRSPLEFDGIRDRYLPDGVAHTKAQHHESKYTEAPPRCCMAVSTLGCSTRCVDGGPTTCGIRRWRRWPSTLRAAADRSVESIESVCRGIAARRSITLTGAVDP